MDAGTAIAFVAAVVAYIELRVRQSLEHALQPLPKRADDVIDPHNRPVSPSEDPP